MTPEIISINNTCLVFVAPPCPAGPSPIQLEYSGNNATIQFEYTSSSPSADIFSISPVSWSPVLKGVLTITGTGFGSVPSAISVYLLPKNSSANIGYQMRVLSVSNTQVTAGIPGGLPGAYDVKVKIEGKGDIEPSDSSADDFVYELVIESISPSSGSYHGGTVLTITGRNFSPNDLENLAFISY